MHPRTLLAIWAALSAASCRPATPGGSAPGDAARADTGIATGGLGDAIRRGRAIVLATRESLPANVGSRLRCVSCHLDEGRRGPGSWVGVYARFPQYRSRSASVELIEDRVNDCFRRSLNGTALMPGARAMSDIVAYLAFLSRGAPVSPPTAASPSRFAALTADTAAGRRLFDTTCVVCHGANGQGTAVAPPLWGNESFNIGAGMARRFTAAAFIHANMPFSAPGTLTDQQALDVAAYVTSRPRPDFPEKQYDWPDGGAPPDVAYRTRGPAPTGPGAPQRPANITRRQR